MTISSSPVTVGLVRFWAFIGAAVLAASLGWGQVHTAIDWWDGPPYCGPNCVVGPPAFGAQPPWLHLVVGVALFAVAVGSVYLAVRARRRRVTTR